MAEVGSNSDASDAGTVIYLTTLCGNATQNWALWDANVTLNTGNPNLTLCFQTTVLPLLACAFLWLSAPFYGLHLAYCKVKHRHTDKSYINITKLFAGLLSCVLHLAAFFRALHDYMLHSSPDAQLSTFLSQGLYTFTMILALVFMHEEYRRGKHTSGVMFVHWLIQILTAIVPFRSIIQLVESEKRGSHDIATIVLFYIRYALMLLQFVLSLIPDHRARTDNTSNLIREETKLGLVVNESRQSSESLFGQEKKDKAYPEIRATFLSQITYFWMTSMMIAGWRKTLTQKDLYTMRDEDDSEQLDAVMESAWAKDDNGKVIGTNSKQFGISHSTDQLAESTRMSVKGPSMLKIYSRLLGLYYVATGFVKLMYDVLTLVQPLLLSSLLNFVSSDDPYAWKGYTLGILLFATSYIRSICFQQFWRGCFVAALRVRTMICTAVYKKTLRLSSSARRGITSGEIVNLMSVDSQKIRDAIINLHFAWSAPLVVIVAMILLWNILGAASLAGMAVIVCLLPFSAWLAKRSQALQAQQMRHKDERIKQTNEVLNGIKVLKLYAWESSFMERVNVLRDLETGRLAKAAILDAISYVTMFVTPYLVSLFAFAVFVLVKEDHVLDAKTAFVSLSFFNIINQPMIMLPSMISYTVQASVSTERIKRYLMAEELDDKTVTKTTDSDTAVSIKDGSFSWTPEDDPVLKEINLEVECGSLTAVVGLVGSGKSSLVSAILGEMVLVTGSVTLKGSVAYVAQQPWIQNLTIKDNILFGERLDDERYARVTAACSLTTDFAIMPDGDATEVGDKGISVSGGQKQRISLARAVYQDNDVYLLDDPLSAVDAHVARHLFKHVVGREGLLKNKTRILVTHNISYLPETDNIVVLNRRGGVADRGTYAELMAKDGPFAEFVRTYLQSEDLEEADNLDEEEVTFRQTLVRRLSTISQSDDYDKFLSSFEEKSRRRSLSRGISLTRSLSVEEKGWPKLKKEIIELKKPVKNTDETLQTGNISYTVLLRYMKSMGLCSILAAVIFYVLYCGTSVYTDIWLSQWSSDGESVNGTSGEQHTNLRLAVYGVLGVFRTVFIAAVAFLLATSGVRSSRRLHSDMLSGIIHSPMAFFDVTPLGRIMNRLSKDLEAVDVNIPITIRMWIGTASVVISTLIVISYSTPIFIAALIPIGLLYYFIQRFYIGTSRQLMRIESVTRSPVFSHFGETVAGASTIRAFQHQQRFIQRVHHLINNNNQSIYLSVMAIRWLGTCLDMIGNFIVLLSCILAVSARETGAISPGLVGLSVSYALRVTGILTLMVRMSCDLETYIVSVERIQEYTQLPSEAPWYIDHSKPSNDWPEKGHVSFMNYSAKYRPELELVVKNITATFKPGEKVGICGRTGAGKSSLTMALFRLIEPESGTIKIDDEDITRLGLHHLRSQLSIIPQEPVLFAGPLRMNLDPLGKHSDAEIWSRLELAHLKNFVSQQAALLQFPCAEGGENLSVGQRQLVCLTRALLRCTKILVLDEATAAVDLETDDLIQQTIRDQFRDSTIITIAHRLNTILDYDRIMVLDQGKIKEFASPFDLLSDNKSQFYSMAKEAGLV